MKYPPIHAVEAGGEHIIGTFLFDSMTFVASFSVSLDRVCDWRVVFFVVGVTYRAFLTAEPHKISTRGPTSQQHERHDTPHPHPEHQKEQRPSFALKTLEETVGNT